MGSKALEKSITIKHFGDYDNLLPYIPNSSGHVIYLQ